MSDDVYFQALRDWVQENLHRIHFPDEAPRPSIDDMIGVVIDVDGDREALAIACGVVLKFVRDTFGQDAGKAFAAWVDGRWLLGQEREVDFGEGFSEPCYIFPVLTLIATRH